MFARILFILWIIAVAIVLVSTTVGMLWLPYWIITGENLPDKAGNWIINLEPDI